MATTKSSANFDYWNTEALFKELRQWVPKAKFQPGEYTTGQVAEIMHTTSANVARWCEEGAFGPQGAFREEARGWWHITETGFNYLTKKIERQSPRDFVKHAVRRVINESKRD